MLWGEHTSRPASSRRRSSSRIRLSRDWYSSIVNGSERVSITSAPPGDGGDSGRNFGNVPQLGRSALPQLVASIGPEDTRFFLAHQARMLDEYEALIREEGIECEFERVNCLLLGHTEVAYQELVALADLHSA